MTELIMKIKGLKRTNRFLIDLPFKLRREINLAGETFMKNVQKSAKLRAPRWKGTLAQSIKVRKEIKGKDKGQIILEVGASYGIFQEKGFRPHRVGAWRSTRSGFSVRDWMREHNASGTGIFVKKHTPFIRPALEHQLSNLPNLLSQHTNKAIKGAKR